MNPPQENPTLKDFVRARLKELKWTQTKLSEVSGVSEGSISNLLNQKSVPETSTVERIADALGVKRQTLFGLLANEQSVRIPEPDIDPHALYIARQLTNLPPAWREAAIDAISGVVDNFTTLSDRYAGIVRQLKALKGDDPELFGDLMEGIDPTDE